MSKTEFILIALLALSVAISIILIVLRVRDKKRINRLSDKINDFIESGTPLDLSINDDSYARLHNAVLDLENKITLEKHNTAEQTRKNSEFISDISHQLKTPLAGLRLYCEIDNRNSPNEHTEKQLRLIEKMEELIQSLLKLEKIKSDAYVMDFRTFEANDIVNGVLGNFYSLFPNKNYVLTGKSELRCDREWLGEAIGNLIKNSSEHTAEDGTVGINITDSDRSTIIEVYDNGGGINEDEIPKLFTRFYKTKNSSSTGAGIGLAISKAIVEKHHGIISAENKNSGLCITICIPHLDGIQSI